MGVRQAVLVEVPGVGARQVRTVVARVSEVVAVIVRLVGVEQALAIVAGVPVAVGVRVGLIVVIEWAVVTSIADAIQVGIELVRVGDEGTIVYVVPIPVIVAVLVSGRARARQ